MRQFFSALKRRRAPQLPEGVRVYAVGDVHGRADLLAQLLSQIDSHLGQNPVSRPIEVFLGDYVDRGPNSRDVIDLLISRRNSHETIFLKGNHEKYILDFLRDPRIWDVWSQYGGFATLLSYGLKPPINSSPADGKELARTFADLLPRNHMLFLSCLMPSFTCGDFFFVHAGVKPGIPLDQQAEKNLLWIRDDFLLSEDDFGKYIVHGHTPVREPDIRSNRANIDTGAFVTGCLSCLVIEGEDMQIIAQNSDSAGKIAEESRRKATVAAASVLVTSKIPELTESSPTIAPRHAIETVGHAGGPCRTQSSSATAGRVVEACSVVEQHPQLPYEVHQQASDERSLTASSGRKRRRIVGGAVFTLLLLTAAPLLVPILAPHWQIGANIGGVEPLVVGSGVAEHGSDPAPAGPADRSAQLILVQSPDRSVGDSAPLGVRVSGDAAGMVVEIGGLPTGTSLSSGRAFGSDGWRIPAIEVANATIHVPQGIAGTTDLVVELRLADDTVVDHGSLRLKWPPSPIVAAQTEATAGELAISPPASQLDREQLDSLLSRSEKLISEGDVAAARILLQRAAEARDSRAAFTLGSTYDPIMLTILEVHGVAADISLARRWYEKARASGSAEAQRRLDILAAAVQTPPAAIDQNAEGVPLPRARPPLSAQDTRGGRQSRAALAGQNR